MTTEDVPGLLLSDAGWDVQRLDLDAYLSRISYAGDRAPTLADLALLHRAHIANVPFENLDVVLGRGIDADLAGVQEKIVTRGRGGYCYEMNVLFGAALEVLGFAVERRLARVGDQHIKVAPRSHLVLIVTVDDVPFLADVGFGSGLLGPAVLVDGAEFQQGAWSYRLHVAQDRSWWLQTLRDGQWAAAYTVPAEATYPIDVTVANHFTSTYPSSPFVRSGIVMRKDASVVRGLRGRQLSVLRADGTESSVEVADDEFAGALAALGIVLDEDEVRALLARPEMLTVE